MSIFWPETVAADDDSDKTTHGPSVVQMRACEMQIVAVLVICGNARVFFLPRTTAFDPVFCAAVGTNPSRLS
jgi:hypothetical protein